MILPDSSGVMERTPTKFDEVEQEEHGRWHDDRDHRGSGWLRTEQSGDTSRGTGVELHRGIRPTREFAPL